ncbi:Fc.00g075490.m01.CDS01 [Cosmosporella sp. VM-42]
MAETTHDIDPDGDTILVLQNANAPFAVWDPNDEWPDALAPKKAGIEETSNDNLEQEASSDAPSSPFLEEQNQPKIRLRVSSRHLALASEYFKKMLSGPWKESNVHPGSEYVVSAADWDLEALLILMNIIHGHVRKVPRDLDVEMFAKIAVLVDYYQCHEVVELFVERWLQNLTTPSEWTYNRDLILRLFIALTFPDDATFTSMTAIALSSARGPLHTLNLPIPTGVLGKPAFKFLDCAGLSLTDFGRSFRGDTTEAYWGPLFNHIQDFLNAFRVQDRLLLRVQFNAPG